MKISRTEHIGEIPQSLGTHTTASENDAYFDYEIKAEV
jgi:hypothetical protein